MLIRKERKNKEVMGQGSTPWANLKWGLITPSSGTHQRIHPTDKSAEHIPLVLVVDPLNNPPSLSLSPSLFLYLWYSCCVHSMATCKHTPPAQVSRFGWSMTPPAHALQCKENKKLAPFKLCFFIFTFIPWTSKKSTSKNDFHFISRFVSASGYLKQEIK